MYVINNKIEMSTDKKIEPTHIRIIRNTKGEPLKCETVKDEQTKDVKRKIMEDKYIILNARGIKIQVKKHLLLQSTRFSKSIKAGEKEIYVNRSAKDVHNFINYLSGDIYKNPEIIDEMIHVYKCELNDAKKFEYTLVASICDDLKKNGKLVTIGKYAHVMMYEVSHITNSFWIKIFAVTLLDYNKKFYDKYVIIKNKPTCYTIYLVKN